MMNVTSSCDDDTTTDGRLEQTASLNREMSHYYFNNKGKFIAEELNEKFSSMVQTTAMAGTDSSDRNHPQNGEFTKKLLRKVKKKGNQNSKQLKKWMRGKLDQSKVEQVESATHIPENENGDEEHTSSIHIQPISREESFLNSAILDEILSEKKRSLLESPEMIEFLQSRIRL